MKNLIINIYKTLFFFDFAIVAAYMLPKIKSSSSALNALFGEGVSFITALVFTFIFIRLVERGRLRVFNTKNKLRHYSLGLLAGIVPIVITALPLFLFKSLAFNGVNIGKPTEILMWLAAVFFNAAATELLLHGYLFKLYRKYYSLPVVTAVITVLYISMNIYIFSNGVIYTLNLLLFNVMLCLIAEYSHSFLAPLTARFFYNAVSSLLFSSLIIAKDYPPVINVLYSGKKLFAGGDMKLEGSIIMLAANILLCAYSIKRLKQKNRNC